MGWILWLYSINTDGSETWPVKVENEMRMNRTEVSMIRCMGGIKLNERKRSDEHRGLSGLEPVFDDQECRL